jgi:adenine/guanine phosphoribosyltransferase-like PRPP-binding protein
MPNHAFWIRNSVRPEELREVASRIGEAIKRDNRNGMCIEAIAVRGVSGLVVGGAISAYSGIPLAIVRKEGDGSHSDYPIEYGDEFNRYCFVDDFISSGTTLARVIDALKERTLVKVYVYKSTEDHICSYQKPEGYEDRMDVPLESWWL